MEPSGKDKDNCSVNSKESDGSWSDWSDDEPIQVPSLVSNKVLGSATDVWNEVKDEFGFDFYSASKTHNWELYDVIKLVNYLRKELPAAPLENREASQAVFDSIKPSAAFWEDEQFLLPTVPNDPLLLLAGEEAWGSDSEEEEPQLPEERVVSSGVQEYLRTKEEGGEESKGDSSNEPDDAYYFDSYSRLGIHEEMLKDAMRTEAYRDAFFLNKSLVEGKRVLDVGCGTGILSMFAATAGAKQVVGVDLSAMARAAQEAVKMNNLDDIVTIIRGRMENVTLPCEKVDIIVSEWMGYALLFESMLSSVIAARDKYLAPGGLVFPRRADMHVCGVSSDWYHNDRIGFWKNVYGYDMSHLQPQAMSDADVAVVPPSHIATDMTTFHSIDISTVTDAELDFEKDFTLNFDSTFAVKEGATKFPLHGLCISFDVDFLGRTPVLERRAIDRAADLKSPAPLSPSRDMKDGPTDIVMKTAPDAVPTHWKQAVLVFSEPVQIPFNAEKTATIKGKLRFLRDPMNQRQYRIRASLTSPLVMDQEWNMK